MINVMDLNKAFVYLREHGVSEDWAIATLFDAMADGSADLHYPRLRVTWTRENYYTIEEVSE